METTIDTIKSIQLRIWSYMIPPCWILEILKISKTLQIFHDSFWNSQYTSST